MIVATTREELSQALAALEGRSLALVPTMGALHEGHLSLLDLALGEADVVAASVFVNPLQFGEGEDLEAYPRDAEGDLALLEARGARLAFLPGPGEVYRGGEPRITVDPGGLADRLCGLTRPGHFRGVLTVVAKLFGLFRPDVAVFGRKDFQQSVLVRRMSEDLDLGARIVVAPIVREPDGLAMSSRNAYLTPEERAEAPTLHRALRAAQEAFAQGERRASRIVERARLALEASGLLGLEYVELVDPDGLEPRIEARPGDVVLVAAHLGRARLIDNEVLGGEGRGA